MTAEAAGVEEVHILWISEGMSCDGDSVSVTAAAQPSIEEVLLGAIPGIPSALPAFRSRRVRGPRVIDCLLFSSAVGVRPCGVRSGVRGGCAWNERQLDLQPARKREQD